MTATILAYVFIVFGLNYFIISKRASVKDAFLLGLVIYGIYEFTNKAILNKVDLQYSVIRTLFGVEYCFASVTFLTYQLEKISQTIIIPFFLLFQVFHQNQLVALNNVFFLQYDE